MRKKKTHVYITFFCIIVIMLSATFLFPVIREVFVNTSEEEADKEPEVQLAEYFSMLKDKKYDEMYEFLSESSKAHITKEEFVKKNKNIYEGIEAKNFDFEVSEVLKDENLQNVSVTYTLRMDTLAGQISRLNQAVFVADEDDENSYHLEWAPGIIFPFLGWDEKVSFHTLTAKRGNIYDRNGALLAGEGIASSIGLVPGKMQGGTLREQSIGEKVQEEAAGEAIASEEAEEDYSEMAAAREVDIEKIAELLEMTPESIRKKLNAAYVKDDTFVPLATVSKDAQELKDVLLQIPGIKIIDQKVRSYPLAEKASHLIGYIQNINAEELESLSNDGYHSNSVLGKAGLEKIYEEQLRAKDGCEIVIIDSHGERKEILAAIPAQDGTDIYLTIDAEVQSELYEQFTSDKSCSVALNPKTGEVLALVSTPSYDANDFVLGMSVSKWNTLNEDENKPMYNRFKAALCPGSTMKTITAAIGVETGIISPDEDFGHSGLSWQKDKSWGGYRITTLTEYNEPANIENGLVYSDNIFFGKAALKIGADTFAEELKKLGFEEKIPFEYGLYSSIISSTESFTSEIQLADSGFGQGQILMNPVHLAVIYAAFMNEGNILKPRLILSGAETPEIWKANAFSPETVATIRNDLVQVIERGTGKMGRINGLTLAGKTGTAEIKLDKEDVDGTELGWFALFTADENVENPLLVVSMVEDVKSRGGSHYVIPHVKALFE